LRDVIDQLAELLGREGYRRRGSRFYREIEDGWLLIDLQQSVTNERTRIRFTLNLAVASKRLDRAHGSRSSTGTRLIDETHWRSRIGHVMPINDDWWWQIDDDTNGDELARDVVRSLREWGIPALASHATDSQLRDYWFTGAAAGQTNSQRLTNLLVLVSELGPTDRLDAVAQELAAAARGKPIEHEAQALIRRYAPNTALNA
jgi:hypothetical protein